MSEMGFSFGSGLNAGTDEEFFVCQLREGKMLSYNGAEHMFHVVETGYPYPDLPKPQLEMICDLLSTSALFKDGVDAFAVSLQLSDAIDLFLSFDVQCKLISDSVFLMAFNTKVEVVQINDEKEYVRRGVSSKMLDDTEDLCYLQSELTCVYKNYLGAVLIPDEAGVLERVLAGFFESKSIGAYVSESLIVVAYKPLLDLGAYTLVDVLESATIVPYKPSVDAEDIQYILNSDDKVSKKYRSFYKALDNFCKQGKDGVTYSANSDTYKNRLDTCIESVFNCVLFEAWLDIYDEFSSSSNCTTLALCFRDKDSFEDDSVDIREIRYLLYNWFEDMCEYDIIHCTTTTDISNIIENHNLTPVLLKVVKQRLGNKKEYLDYIKAIDSELEDYEKNSIFNFYEVFSWLFLLALDNNTASWKGKQEYRQLWREIGYNVIADTIEENYREYMEEDMEE